MNQILNAAMMAAGVTAGFGILWWLRQRKKHECQFEVIFQQEMDACEIPTVTDVRRAEWCFGVCQCGNTRHMIGVMHSDKSIEIFPCLATGTLDEEE